VPMWWMVHWQKNRKVGPLIRIALAIKIETITSTGIGIRD